MSGARLGCWLSWPPGHAFEAVQAFDEVAGRWAAGVRCALCGTHRRLRIGDHDPIAASSPLLVLAGHVPPTTEWIPPVRDRRSPAGRRPDGSVEVSLPDGGGTVLVRRVRVVAGARAGHVLYRAERPGARPVLEAELRRAIARVAGASGSESWLDAVARELTPEL